MVDRPPPRLRPFVARLLAVAVVAALVLALWQLSNLLLLLFGAVLLGIALRAGAERLARVTPLKPAWAVPVVLLLALGMLVGVGWLTGDRVASQFGELARKLPAAADGLQAWVDRQPWGGVLVELGSQAEPGAGLLSRLGGWASSLAAGVTSLVLMLMVAVYMAVDPHSYRKGLVALAPPDLRPDAAALLHEIGANLRSWLVGQAIAMLSIGVATTIGLLLLGIPLALALGVLAGLLEFIPYIGPVLSALPAILLAFAQSPADALWTALLYLGIQQAEGHLVIPLIQQRVVSLPPVLTVAATVGMGMLFGFPGLLFATPLVLVALVVVKRVYVEGLLEGGEQ